MRPETQTIWRLVGKLIDSATPHVTTNTSKGRAPKPVADKIRTYTRSGFAAPIWTHADHDILVMMAMADLMWENRISPLKGKDETALQVELGVNALSERATVEALSQMNDALGHLKLLRDQCAAMPPLATAIVGKSAMLGPANASQVGFDRMGAEELKKRCQRNTREIERILPRLRKIVSMNEEVLRAHRRH